MRPSSEQLLASLRLSLNETVKPAVTDRWARYVASAMDLMLQHLQLRLAGEDDALRADNADMSRVLADVAATAVSRGESDRWGALIDVLTGPMPADGLELNEALRERVVGLMRWLDQNDPGRTDPDLQAIRDDVHRLIRRQVDRVGPMVEPLHMSFAPAAAR